MLPLGPSTYAPYSHHNRGNFEYNQAPFEGTLNRSERAATSYKS